LVEELVGFTEEAQRETDGGKFLPLSVYEKQGFDPEMIRTRSKRCDIREDPVLGTVYRVRILEQATETKTGTVRNSKVAAKAKAKAMPLAIADRPAMAALTDGQLASDAGNSSKSSYSSSSSESSSHRKHRHKKSKKSHKKSKKDHRGKKEKDRKRDKVGRGITNT
jgi:hypothetical protein